MDERIDLTENRDFRDQSRNIESHLNIAYETQKQTLDANKYYKRINICANHIIIESDFYDGADPRFTCDRCGRKEIRAHYGLCDRCHRDLEYEYDAYENLFKESEINSIL